MYCRLLILILKVKVNTRLLVRNESSWTFNVIIDLFVVIDITDRY